MSGDDEKLVTASAEMMIKPTCGACLFFEVGEADPANIGQKQYFCRRNPPIPIPMPVQSPQGQIGFAIHSMNPMVNPTSWCGEFEPVEGDTDDELENIDE